MPTSRRPLRILQVNKKDARGGAANVAGELHRAYRKHGHEPRLAVGWRLSDDPHVLAIENDRCRGRWARFCLSFGGRITPWTGKVRGAGRLRRWLYEWIGQPRRWLEIQLGREDMDFPATWQLLNLSPERPDLVHLHNLHGGYFDLRALSSLSQQVPVVLTLHDAWLLSGHCAHSLACERWKIGCGACPDLTIYPPIPRDATACNWKRKKEIYAASRLYVATPSDWLMQKVEQSMLASAMVQGQVIHNGANLSVYHPAEKQDARDRLGVPPTKRVLLFAAQGIRDNTWKDYPTMRDAVARVAESLCGEEVLFIALGEDGEADRIGQAEVRFVPYQRDPATVARYYQAADVYVHAARVETFPNTILEALACGTPVVATAVGGIPEQIEEGVTGFLVPAGDGEAMSERIVRLLLHEQLRRHMSTQAAESACRDFGLDLQANRYLAWYKEILKTW